jgi:hypothetical protein
MVEKLLQALKERYGKQLISVVLFGSVARAEEDPGSDLDLIVVCGGFPRDMSSRMAELVEVLTEVERSEPFEQARKSGMSTWVQFHPLTPSEAKLHRPIYLDVVEDGILLLDAGDFMGMVLKGLKRRLEELGARRIKLKNGSWYWDLKPDLKFGEEVEI